MTASGATSAPELAWDEAARGYDDYFAPRFAPYVGVGVGALLAHADTLPSAGSIVVPCVGPGRELPPLARAFPERVILASDWSSEMLSIARQRSAAFSNVSLDRADATALGLPQGTAAGLLSIFGLQLLPNQPATLAAWLRLLAPIGRAVIVFWPGDSEASGPFHSMRRLLRSAGVLDGTWESELESSVTLAQATLRVDRRFAFEMRHDDAATVWRALTRLGPLRGLALARGQAFVDALGADFVADLPPGPLVHSPEARLLVIERG